MKTSLLQLATSGRRATGFMVVVTLFVATPLRAAEAGRAFATPEAAVAALASATTATNREELRAILGPAADDVVNPDTVQAANEFAAFATALGETNRLARESDTRRVLEVGRDH